jgi:hypothetical protein
VALVAFGGVASSFVASSFVATSFVATSLFLGASLFGVAAFGVAASPSAFGFVSAFGMTTSFVAFHSKEDAVGRAEAVEAVGVEERVRFLDAVSTAEVAEDIGVAGRGGAGAEDGDQEREQHLARGEDVGDHSWSRIAGKRTRECEKRGGVLCVGISDSKTLWRRSFEACATLHVQGLSFHRFQEACATLHVQGLSFHRFQEEGTWSGGRRAIGLVRVKYNGRE